MRIAIVDPYFAVGLGYQPTGWFNALVANGHQVRAFASCHVYGIVQHLYDRPFEEGLEQIGGGEVLRLPSRRLPREMVKCVGLIDEVVAFSPELTLAVYPGTLFARELFACRERLPGCLFSTFGENRAQRRLPHPSMTKTMKRLAIDAAFHVLKRPYYRLVMEKSDVILAQTPDTADFLLPRCASGSRLRRFRAKSVLMPLGFESSLFRPDAEARRAQRRALGLADDDVVAVYSCKITRTKRLDIWVSVLTEAMRRVPQLKALLVGFREGNQESERIAGLIDKNEMASRFIRLPFASREQLPDLYNAADFGLWHWQPSVSIQEAMGTGLYMILTRGATVSHLLLEPATGRYFPEQEYSRAVETVVDVARAYGEGAALSDWSQRVHRAELNARRFSYEAMAELLVAAAADLPNASRILSFETSVPAESSC